MNNKSIRAASLFDDRFQRCWGCCGSRRGHAIFHELFPVREGQGRGAPVEVDIGKIEAGQKINVEWRGKPVWILSRTPEQIKNLPKNDPKLVDPQSEVEQQPKYCQNEHRSIKPQFLVAVGICTHLGCSPTFRPDLAPADLGPDWLGGFYCPCHGSKFDLAARVFKGCRRRRTWKSPAQVSVRHPPADWRRQIS
ncbi:Ubiquinol-cytochrome c reductase iron-sulfur subunit [Chromobacterium violaceum]|uniref:Ubiquinol-cytochrome c reductase iron-sulfur subunit n=1 Tax=Chromobacterium violaceum TaxID=536 RepID=A0A3S4HLZ3_CHRVL|nr:Ubiquinol-cytochrome c reductase iron-sulfur subunit [Chromobacterium violaceum]